MKLFGTKNWNSKSTITKESFERDVKAAIKQAEQFKPNEPVYFVSPSEYKKFKAMLNKLIN